MFHRHRFDITGSEQQLLSRKCILIGTEVDRIHIDRLSHRRPSLVLLEGVTIAQDRIGVIERRRTVQSVRGVRRALFATLRRRFPHDGRGDRRADVFVSFVGVMATTVRETLQPTSLDETKRKNRLITLRLSESSNERIVLD